MSYKFSINDKVRVSNPNVGTVKGIVTDRNNEELGNSTEQYRVAYTTENGTEESVWFLDSDVSADED